MALTPGIFNGSRPTASNFALSWVCSFSVQAFKVTRRPTVQDDSEHQSEERGTKALESRLARSRRVARKSALASAFKSQPKASAIC